jgi:hypothetical protein
MYQKIELLVKISGYIFQKSWGGGGEEEEVEEFGDNNIMNVRRETAR